jgi:SSS family solute:Na+ symporter
VTTPAIVSSFSALDAAIAVLSLAATLAIGLGVKRYIGSIEDYLVASRGMGLYIGAASLLSTEVGIITYMYQAQFGFVAGFSAFVTGLITLAVCLAVGRSGFVIGRLRELEILTVPEYFETRYGRRVRVLAGLLMAFGGSLNLGIFPIIEARFLAIVTGIPPAYLGWTMAALLLVALVYTAIGGMVSLIVTNYVQYVFLAAGTLIVTAACLREVGWTPMVRAVEQQLDGRGFDPIADFGVGFVVWQVLLWIALMTVWQSVAMRTFSTKDTAVGRRMFTLTGFLFLGRAVIPMAWGIAALGFFHARSQPAPEPKAAQVELAGAGLGGTFQADLDSGRIPQALARVELTERQARDPNADPLQAERLSRAARAGREEIGLVAMPWMLAAVLPTGLVGLIVAGMLAASVSTYAGYFLGWAGVIAQDVAAPLAGRELSGTARLRLTRVTVVALTLFIMVWSLVYDLPGPAYFYLQVTANLFMAPTLVAVVGGLYWRAASAAGAVASFVLGAAASLAYLVPRLGLDVAEAGNLSWALAVGGFVIASLLWPDRRPASPSRGAAQEVRG